MIVDFRHRFRGPASQHLGESSEMRIKIAPPIITSCSSDLTCLQLQLELYLHLSYMDPLGLAEAEAKTSDPSQLRKLANFSFDLPSF